MYMCISAKHYLMCIHLHICIRLLASQIANDILNLLALVDAFSALQQQSIFSKAIRKHIYKRHITRFDFAFKH